MHKTISDPVLVSKISVVITSPIPQVLPLYSTFAFICPSYSGWLSHRRWCCPSQFDLSLLVRTSTDQCCNQCKYSFPIPEVYGNCTLEVGPNDPVFQAASNVNVTIAYQLTIINYPSTIYLNQSFQIELTTISSVPSDLTANLTLNCDFGVYNYTWYDVPLNTSKLFSPFKRSWKFILQFWCSRNFILCQ